jgi:spore coat protein U-like protein
MPPRAARHRHAAVRRFFGMSRQKHDVGWDRAPKNPRIPAAIDDTLEWRGDCSTSRSDFNAIEKNQRPKGETKMTRKLARKSLVAAAVTCLIAVAPALAASPQTTSLAVSAAVSDNCTISSSPLAFGAYDPIVTHATAALDGSGGLTITCTKGAATTVGLDLGANAAGSVRRMAAGSERLSYEMYQDSARSTVWGNSGSGLYTPPAAPSKAPRTYTVYGKISAGQDVAAGNYGDTVVATVNF